MIIKRFELVICILGRRFKSWALVRLFWYLTIEVRTKIKSFSKVKSLNLVDIKMILQVQTSHGLVWNIKQGMERLCWNLETPRARESISSNSSFWKSKTVMVSCCLSMHFIASRICLSEVLDYWVSLNLEFSKTGLNTKNLYKASKFQVP